MFVLSITSVDNREPPRRFPWNPPQELTVGRAPDNRVVLSNDNKVSRAHLRMTFRDEKVWVADLGSTFGTWVNGERIVDAVPVSPSDSIRVGSFLLAIHPEGQAGEDRSGESGREPVAARRNDTGEDIGMDASYAAMVALYSDELMAM